jgi:hypothetical protein
VLLQQTIGGTPAGFSPPDYLAFEARAGLFESIAAFRNREYELSGVETRMEYPSSRGGRAREPNTPCR